VVGSDRILPNRSHYAFLWAGPGPRKGDHLIPHGTIAPVNNFVELARLAVEARVPGLFVGKPFGEGDSHWEQFRLLVDNQCIWYHPHVASEFEMIGLLQQARGGSNPARRLCRRLPMRDQSVMKVLFHHLTWLEVGLQLKRLYERLLNPSAGKT
jgi:hypothetical protein